MDPAVDIIPAEVIPPAKDVYAFSLAALKVKLVNDPPAGAMGVLIAWVDRKVYQWERDRRRGDADRFIAELIAEIGRRCGHAVLGAAIVKLAQDKAKAEINEDARELQMGT